MRELDCDVCRRYWHYSENAKDGRLACTPVYGQQGELLPWPPKSGGPDCRSCSKRRMWTEGNRALVDLVRAFRATRGNVDLLAAWGWDPADWQSEAFRDALLVLEDELREIEDIKRARRATQDAARMRKMIEAARRGK